MKIEQLLELQKPTTKPSQKMAQQKDLAQANAAQAKQGTGNPQVGQSVIPDVSNPAVSMATTNPMQTTTSAPANGPVQQLQGTNAEEPNTQVAPAAAKTGSFIPQKWVDNAKRGWDTATQVGRGINTVAQGTVKGVKNAADVTGDVINTGGNLINRTGKSINTAAQGVKTAATGIGDAGAAAGNAVANTVQGIGNAGAAVGNAVADTGQGVANAVRSVGDIAGAATGAVTNPIGGFAGGVKRGYNKQTGGGAGTAALKNVAGIGQQSAGSAGSNDELAQLQATIQQMDQRMRRSGI